MTDIPVCGKCGQQHLTGRGQNNGKACTGHRSRDGGQCTNPPMHGQDVCGKHGGTTPRALAAAERRLAELQAHREIQKLIPDNPTPVTDPIAVLAALAGEANEVRKIVADRVNELSELRTTDKQGVEQLNAYVTLYERFLDRTARICESLVKSNYLERQSAIEQAKLITLLAVVERGLRLIDDPDIRRAVTTEISSGLQKLPQAS